MSLQINNHLEILYFKLVQLHDLNHYEFGFLNINRPKPVRDSFKLNIQSINSSIKALGSQGLKKKLGSSAKRKKKTFY